MFYSCKSRTKTYLERWDLCNSRNMPRQIKTFVFKNADHQAHPRNIWNGRAELGTNTSFWMIPKREVIQLANLECFIDGFTRFEFKIVAGIFLGVAQCTSTYSGLVAALRDGTTFNNFCALRLQIFGLELFVFHIRDSVIILYYEPHKYFQSCQSIQSHWQPDGFSSSDLCSQNEYQLFWKWSWTISATKSTNRSEFRYISGSCTSIKIVQNIQNA